MIKKLLASKVFRYFLSAGVATWVDILVYFIAFNYIYEKQDVNLFSKFVISAPTAALALSYTAGLLTNFFITKYIVFKESDLETHKQLFRYVLVAMVVLVLNYIMMRLLIRKLDWYPTIARAVSAISIGMFSFVVHKSFSFKVSNTGDEVTK
ncbi:MAG: GtrA family protein [Bacteroidota bacterium]